MRSRLAFLLLLSTLIGACVPVAQKKGPSPDAAIDLMFQNKYSAASDQLQSILRNQPQDARSHAAYALLLNYRQRQHDALVEAQEAQRLAPNDGYVLAILTRVQDWNDQIAAAVATGEEAVKASPQSPLARAFYGEALADLRRFDEAAAQLKRAGELAAKGSAFEKAEVERNWGNFYRARRDNAQAMDHFKLAAKAQPNWVERVLELARFSIVTNDLPGATSYLRRASEMQPDDPALREELGTVALVAQDYDVAKSAYSAALKLQPRSALDLKMLGTIAIALEKDIPTGLKDQRAALAIEPSDAEAGAYVVAILRYLQNDEAGATQAAQRSVVPREGSGAAQFVDLEQVALGRQAAALAILNEFRRAAGVPTVGASAQIQQSARSHAYYTFFNGASPAIRDLGIHRESRDGLGYTGDDVLKRAQHFGYPARPMAEDITHRGGPEAAVRDWIDSVYHRIPILRADLLEIGYGEASLGPLNVQVLDMGFRDAGAPGQVVVYPAPDQADVPPAFFGNEIPDPAPNAVYPIGYPITVIFDRRATVAIRSYHLRDPSGTDLPGIALQPSNETENAFAFMAKEPLQGSTIYTMEVEYTINGVPSQRKWRFQTRSTSTRTRSGEVTVAA